MIPPMRALLQRSASRSIQELSKKGRCLDNMRNGESTIPFAGRGAFATRPLKKGDIITGSPLVHVPGRLADMFAMKRDLLAEK